MKTSNYAFKPMFLAYVCFITPFSVFQAILALLHITPVVFIDKPRYGLIGFIVPF
jgi:hypothetical protein